ncbi:MAG: 3-hydroxy-3-methylglutaryl-CoA reductase, partial [Anaerolineae bacterium]|nr:3-hydroxy-3-methylglutaryl-CoA reductase [Anaerolineae bacterium]
MVALSSRLPGFYKLSLEERVAAVAQRARLDRRDEAVLLGQGLSAQTANEMIENGIGTYALPLGVAVNFRVDGRDLLIPMAVEEPSVLAAVSNAAKMVRAGGGFSTEATDPVMIGQIQLLDLADLDQAAQTIADHKAELTAAADACSRSMVRRGGGACDLEVRAFPDTP